MMLCNLGQFLCPIKWIWKYAFEATQWIWRYAFEASQWIWSYAYEATQLIWSNSYENAMGLDVFYEATQWIFETMLMKQTMDLRSNAIDLDVC